jgi:glycosyltransferase involved in cell wall biosynthesis
MTMAAADARQPSGNRRPLVSVLIPAYDEGAMLQQNLGQVHETLCGLAARYRSEIVVVDDGSGDDTHEVATRFQA